MQAKKKPVGPPQGNGGNVVENIKKLE
jgi:kinesin family member 2/24